MVYPDRYWVMSRQHHRVCLEWKLERDVILRTGGDTTKLQGLYEQKHKLEQDMAVLEKMELEKNK